MQIPPLFIYLIPRLAISLATVTLLLSGCGGRSATESRPLQVGAPPPLSVDADHAHAVATFTPAPDSLVDSQTTDHGVIHLTAAIPANWSAVQFEPPSQPTERDFASAMPDPALFSGAQGLLLVRQTGRDKNGEGNQAAMAAFFASNHGANLQSISSDIADQLRDAGADVAEMAWDFESPPGSAPVAVLAYTLDSSLFELDLGPISGRQRLRLDANTGMVIVATFVAYESEYQALLPAFTDFANSLGLERDHRHD